MGITVVLFIVAIAIDFIFTKRINTKRDIIFYIVFMSLTFAFAIYYFSDQYRNSFLYYVLKVFNM